MGAAFAAPRHLLVVAAHPDDETIGAGALIGRSEGAVVVHLTDGAPHDRRFWPEGAPETAEEYACLRRRELRRALARSGARRAVAVSLGVRDQETASQLAPIAIELAGIVSARRPNLLLAHAYEGGHPDHDAAAFVARAAVALVRRAGGRAPRLVEMTSYHAAGGELETGAFLPAAAGREWARRLTAEERSRKEAMLAAFVSQRAVLARFRADEERFRTAAPCDFGAAPHSGPLWYERVGFPVSGEEWRHQARRAADELQLPLGELQAGDAGPGHSA